MQRNTKTAINWNFNNRDLKRRLAIYKDKERRKAELALQARRDVCATLERDTANFIARGGTIEELPTYRDDPVLVMRVDHALALI